MGILRTASRAYVATRVVGSTHRRQQQQWAAQDAAATMAAQAAVAHPMQVAQPMQVAPTPPAPAPKTDAVIAQLTQLASLRDAGVLTEAEFEVQKHRALSGG